MTFNSNDDVSYLYPLEVTSAINISQFSRLDGFF
jgi:hypothetical protein